MDRSITRRAFVVMFSLIVLVVPVVATRSNAHAGGAGAPMSYRETPTACGNQTVETLTPKPGQGLPIADLEGLTGDDATSAATVSEESASFDWVSGACNTNTAVGPDMPVTSAAAPASSSASTGEEDFVNWSGEDTHGGNAYQKVEMTFHQPKVNALAGVSRYSSSWVGLGHGTSKSDLLVQTGTEADQVNGTTVCYPWWEEFPCESQQVLRFTISPGDVIHVYVGHTGEGQALISIADTTTGKGTAFYATWSSDYSLGNNAEWILERTEENGRFPALARINNGTYVLYYDMRAKTNSGSSLQPVGNLDRRFVYMTRCDGGGPDLAKPGSIYDSDHVHVNWLSVGDTCKA